PPRRSRGPLPPVGRPPAATAEACASPPSPRPRRPGSPHLGSPGSPPWPWRAFPGRPRTAPGSPPPGAGGLPPCARSLVHPHPDTDHRRPDDHILVIATTGIRAIAGDRHPTVRFPLDDIPDHPAALIPVLPPHRGVTGPLDLDPFAPQVRPVGAVHRGVIRLVTSHGICPSHPRARSWNPNSAPIRPRSASSRTTAESICTTTGPPPTEVAVAPAGAAGAMSPGMPPVEVAAATPAVAALATATICWATWVTACMTADELCSTPRARPSMES